jgi:sensor domain CHASE-containing protein
LESVRSPSSRRPFRIAAIVAVWLFFATAGAWWLVFLPAQRLDVQAAQREADVCEGFLAAEMARLRATALDWANWDDLERYLQTPQEAFAVENVTQNALRNLDIDGMLLVKKDGSLQRREVAGPNQSLYMGSANFLERTAPLRALAAEKGASASVIGSAGHLYVVAAAPVLGTDATGPSSGEVVVFSIVTDADLGNYPGIEDASITLLPPGTEPLAKNTDGDPAQIRGPMVTHPLTGHDGTEAAQFLIYHEDTHAELARRAVLFFAAAGVLLAVMLYAFRCAGTKDRAA